METVKSEMSDRERIMPAGQVRVLSEEDWIERHASGSLRKSKRLGFAYRSLYMHERCAHEFGWTFQILPRTRVTLGEAQMEGDCAPLTETCWFAERLIARNPFPDSDGYEVRYIRVSDTNDEREGVGVVVTKSAASWIPSGHLVFAIIAEWTGNAWRKAENPC